MKEKDTKRKVNKVDLDKIKDGTVLKISESTDYIVVYETRDKIDIKKEIIFQFDNEDISSDVHLRIISDEASNIELKVIILAQEGVKNVSSVLDMRALLLNDQASMTFVPSLEIDEMNVSVDHKSTIGTPSKIWLEYMASRGLNEKESIKLLRKSFLSI